MRLALDIFMLLVTIGLLVYQAKQVGELRLKLYKSQRFAETVMDVLWDRIIPNQQMSFHEMEILLHRIDTETDARVRHMLRKPLTGKD